MRHFVRKWVVSLGALALIVSMGLQPVWADCPSPKQIIEGAKKITPQQLDVIKIAPSAVPGLCEVVIKVKGRPRILYTDPKGEYFVLGQIIKTKDGHNLTREATQKLNRLSPEDLAKLESLTAFKLGAAEKTIYFVTDPQCPYCKKAEKDLKQMIEDGEITVKFLLFPLKFHKGAKEECISIICDSKGLEGLETGYKSDNQCEEGKKKVEDTLSLLSQKGISGTPTYIFPDGTFHSGVMTDAQLRAKLGLKPKPMPEKTPPAATVTPAPAAPAKKAQ